MQEVKLIIDDKEIIATSGETIFKVAERYGIEIPHLCYHKNLSISGACRLCLVEVEGSRTLVASCAYPVSNGMKVKTNSERVITARKMILELLLSDHPFDCMTCEKNGNCKLQEYAYEYNVKDIRFAGEKRKLPVENGNPFIIRDYEKCILCGRCVRTCQEVMVVNAIEFANRGFKTKVSTAFEIPLLESGCVECGNCIAVCPVGALREKQAEAKGRVWEFKKVKTVCPYCGVGCNIELNVKDNKVVKITSWEDSPVNSGWLCVKGRFGFEFINHPDRLKKPLIKKDGEFKEASWDEALNLVANKLKEIKEKYGPDSIAGLSSAKCTNEENYLFQKFMRCVIGTNNIDHCARLCHAPSVAGLVQSFGSGAMTNSIEDISKATCFIVIGSNTTETHPVISLQIKKAVTFNNAKLIVIDPREIPLCEIATLHLKQKPGTDVAVLNGIMQQIIEMGLEDKEFINKRCEGYEEFKEVVLKYTPEKVSRITSIPKELIKEAAKLYGEAERGCIIYSMGITQHTTGTDNVISIANLAMLKGFIGKEGCGVNPLRGQNNVQGSCDMGALPNVFSGYQSVADENIRKKFEDAWGVKLPDKVGLTVVEMMKNAEEGKIKAMFIMGENPLLSDPDIGHVEKALNNLEFLVVQDIFLTETAKFADVVLPSCSFAEKDGTFTNTERRVQLLNKAIEEVGESKPDWEIICKLSNLMGYKMNYNSTSEIMDEIAKLTPIYAGISHKRLKDTGGIQWPCPAKEHPGTKILHTEKFTRGLGKFIPVEYKEPKEIPDKEFPFILTTGRILPHYHTGTMTRKVEGLNQIAPSAVVEINKEDAKKLKINDGEKVKVKTRRGEIEVKAKITEKIMEGVIFIPFHFKEAAANILTNPEIDPVSKIPEFKVCAARIEKI